MGAPLQHFVHALCPHALSDTLRPLTSSLRFVECSRKADGRIFVLVLEPGTAGTTGTAAERGKRLLARNSEDEQTLVPPSRPDARY